MRTKLVIAGFLLAALAAASAGGYWYSHRAEKLTEADTVLLADFANRTGDPVFNDSLREALAISLSQSPLLNLVSEEKISESLRSQGRATDAPITRDLAATICKRLASTAYVTGGVAKEDAKYVLQLEAVRCATGDSIASARSEAARDRKSVV